MYKRMMIILGVLLFVFAISTAAYAENALIPNYTPNVSIGVRASTAGLGAEAKTAITDWLGLRVGINYLTYSYTGVESDVEYDLDLNLLSAPILVDWHPFKGSFRLSGGIFINGNEINAQANGVGLGTFDINGVTYTAAQIGTLKGKIDFNPVAPYLGFGWDTSFGKERGFGFVFELGAFYQGRPEADLSVTGPIASSTAFINDLAQEESDLQDALDIFKVYPILSIGINYKF